MKKNFVITLIICMLAIGISFNRTEAAQSYPVKPINFVVALEAGADGDIMVRPIVQSLSAMLGQPFMVSNKPGAGSTIGYREIHAAKPDGYTID